MTIVEQVGPASRPPAVTIYGEAIDLLEAAAIPFLVSGAAAFTHYTGITRRAKDLDLVILPTTIEPVLTLFEQAGFQTELTSPLWIGKAIKAGVQIDLLFGLGNGLAQTEPECFVHAVPATLYGRTVYLSAAEDLLYAKAFVMDRDRYDGADVAHLLRARAEQLDWSRLLHLFGEHWPILLSHLVLFGYIYPGERERLPAGLVAELCRRLDAGEEQTISARRYCRGPLLARSQYRPDIEYWGYRDPRLPPWGPLTSEQLRH